MGYLNKICNTINDQLKARSFKDARFAGAQYFGLANPITYMDGDKVRTKMVELTNNGEVVTDDLFYDDTHPLHVFHVAKESIWREDAKEDYGNNIATRRITNVSMLVFAKRSVIKLDCDDLDLLIKFGLPFNIMNIPTYGSVGFVVEKCDYNQRTIFSEEFGYDNYTMEPDIVLVRLKYRLECTVSPDCVKIICC